MKKSYITFIYKLIPIGHINLKLFENWSILIIIVLQNILLILFNCKINRLYISYILINLALLIYKLINKKVYNIKNIKIQNLN
jgi:hypothetical protein